jgi:hypothetical protein
MNDLCESNQFHLNVCEKHDYLNDLFTCISIYLIYSEFTQICTNIFLIYLKICTLLHCCTLPHCWTAAHCCKHCQTLPPALLDSRTQPRALLPHTAAHCRTLNEIECRKLQTAHRTQSHVAIQTILCDE